MTAVTDKDEERITPRSPLNIKVFQLHQIAQGWDFKILSSDAGGKSIL